MNMHQISLWVRQSANYTQLSYLIPDIVQQGRAVLNLRIRKQRLRNITGFVQGHRDPEA